MNTHPFKKWALIGAVAVFGGIALWKLSAHEGDLAHQVDRSAKSEATDDQAASPCRLPVGETASWSIDSTATFKLDPTLVGGAADLDTPETTSQFHAVLDVEVLREDGADGAVLLGQLRELDSDALQRTGDMTKPFLLRVGADCSVDAFARHLTSGLTPARAQQATLHELWWKEPHDAKQEVRGINSRGVFSAVVAKELDKKGEFAQRRIVRYTQSYAPTGQALDVQDSLLTVRFGEHGWFDSMEGRDESVGGGTKQASTRLSVKTAPPRPHALATADRQESAYKWENLLPQVPNALAAGPKPFTDEEKREHAMLAAVSFESALTGFAHVVQTEHNIDTQWRVMARWLEAHPEAIPTYAGALLSSKFPNKMEAVAFMALGKARVPEARHVLMEMRASPDLDPYDRIRSTLALVGREDVGVELAQQLHASAQHLTNPQAPVNEAMYARNSLLGLGMLAGLRGSAAPDVQAEAKAGILEALATATTAEQLSPVFSAMGNMGDLSMLPTIATWSHHPDVEIRALVPDAMSRLRWMDISEFTLEWLQRETAPDVKEAIYRVVRAQMTTDQKIAPDDLVQQSLKDLAQQPPLFTRQLLVRILGPVAAKNPLVRAALVQQAMREVGTKSGLYTAISQYVPGADISKAFHEKDAAAPAPTAIVAPNQPKLGGGMTLQAAAQGVTP